MPAKRKRRPRGLFKRGDIWWGRLTIDGTLHRRSLRTRDATAARRRYDEWKERVNAAEFGDARKTWIEAAAEWAEDLTGRVGPLTARRYAVSLRQLEPWLKPLFLDQIDKVKVQEIVAGRRKAVTTATLRRDLTALSSVLEFHDAPNAALERLRKLKERRDPIVLPDLADIESVAALAPGQFADLIRVALLTGCRQAELAAAERRHVNFERGELTVIGKRRKLRVMPLSDRAMAIIRAMPVRLGCPWLFWHGEGEPYRSVAARFAELTRRAQKQAQSDGRSFRRFAFHHLRHRFAVDFLKSGGNIYTLQGLLGHGSVKTTELYLMFLTPEEARRAKFGETQKVAQSKAV